MHHKHFQDATKLQDTDEFYAFVDLELTAEQKTALEQLSIHKSAFSHYTNYGELEKIEVELNHFIANMGELNPAVALVIVNLIIDIIDKVRDYFKQESAYIILRSYGQAIPTYDVPRWHVDGNFYKQCTYGKLV